MSRYLRVKDAVFGVFYVAAEHRAHIGSARTGGGVKRRSVSSLFSLHFQSDGIFCYPCSVRTPSLSPSSATPAAASATINLHCVCVRVRAYVCEREREGDAQVISQGSESAGVVNPVLGHAPGLCGLLQLLIQTLISLPQTPAQSAQCRPWLASQTDQ